MMIKNLLTALLFLPTFIFGQNTVVDIIVGSDDHNTLEAAVLAAGLETTLASEGPFTVFAPTDDAFAALPAGLIDNLLENPGGALTNILLQHVAAGTALSTDLNDGDAIPSLFGEELNVVINADGVFIDGAKVTMADIPADNGVVHVIDAVIVPEGNFNTIMDIVTTSDAHNTLQTVLNLSGLNETLNGPGSFTLFAPTDDAFSAIPQDIIDALLADPMGQLTDILLYHALVDAVQAADISDQLRVTTINGRDVIFTINSEGVFINNAQITVTDLPGTNGFVHVIDAVILPGTTVFDIVAGSADHTILETAIRAAGLEDFISTAEITLFAPNDAAFNALPDGTVDFLIQNPDVLTEILANHGLIEAYESSEFIDPEDVALYPSYAGYGLTVLNENGNFTVNDIPVDVADIPGDNGFVNVISSVILNPDSTIVDVVRGSAVHTVLDTLIDTAGEEVIRILESYGPFTLFAPVDDAFGGFTQEEIEALLDDPETIIEILGDHLVFGQALSTDLMDGMELTTANENTLLVTINTDGVFINNVEVILPDVTTDNGVVHVVDAVIEIPSNTILDIVVNSPDHNILEAAVLAASLEGALGDEGESLTLFAPTDDAFNALPDGLIDELLMDPSGALTDILLYHVAPVEAFSGDLTDGQMVMTLNGKDVTVTIDNDGVLINNARVTVADIPADNGVVHVIDAVLIPPTVTVLDIIQGSAAHTTLATAINVAGLEDALEGEGPFTVFAPTDDAFNALPDGLLDALLADPMGALTDVLLYHVAPVEAFSGDLTDGQMVMTLNGNDVVVTIDNEGVLINNARVTLADLPADNGVVHVIDAVLVPPTPEPVALPIDFELPADSYNYLGFEGAESVIEPNPDQSGINTSATVMRTTKTDGAQFFAGTLIDLDENIDLSKSTVLNIDTWSPKADIPVRIALESNGGGNQIFVDVNTTVANAWETLSVDFGNVIDPNVDYGRVVVFFEFIVDLPGDGSTYYFDNVRLAPLPTIVDIVVGSDVHNTLEAAVIAAGLVETLQGDGPFTVFAPTDDAFNNLPDGVLDALLADPMGALTSVLLYHVAEGNVTSDQLSDGQEIVTVNGNTVTVKIDNGMVMINDALVTIADIPASNGVVHVIDAVLVPPTNTVLDIIQGSSVHTTLATAINLAGLEATLQGEGPFTIFAPTDAAFEALPDGVLDALLADPEGALRDVLLYHVVAGTRLAASLNDGESITTVLGQDINVSITSEGVFINTAQVTMTDLEGDNGVVHVIDAVLTPTTSTKDQIIETAEVFPNPVNDMLQYNISSLTKELVTVTIYDNQGRIVTRLNNNPTLGSFDVSSLSNGVYTIVFENNEIVAKNRLMKM